MNWEVREFQDFLSVRDVCFLKKRMLVLFSFFHGFSEADFGHASLFLEFSCTGITIIIDPGSLPYIALL